MEQSTANLERHTSPNLTSLMKLRRTIQELAMEHVNEGHSTAQTAKCLKVSQRTNERWVKTGCTLPSEKSSRLKGRKLSDEQEDSVLEYIEQNSGNFQGQVVKYVLETHGVHLDLHSLESVNQVRLHSQERDQAQSQVQRGKRHAISPSHPRCLRTQSCMFPSVDEMSVMLYVALSYGYARKGLRAIVKQPSRRTVSYMLTLCICPIKVT